VLEVNKRRAQDLGIDWGSVALSSRALAISQPFVFGHRVAGGSLRQTDPTGAALRALVQQNAVHVVCETPLPVRVEETGGIHIGGEIPIPVPQRKHGKTASIAYRPFGISLGVDMLSIGEERLSLRVRSEVSTINPSTSVRQRGSDLPGLRANRADSAARIRPGESLAIGGLMLQNQVKQNPVLGELLKSHSFPRGESDLLILVTPELKENG
jgi:pilus assembly protein CpaC